MKKPKKEIILPEPDGSTAYAFEAERRENERLIRENQAFLDSLIRSLPCGMETYDKNLNLTFVNNRDHFLPHLQTRMGDLIGAGARDIYEANPGVVRKMAEAMLTEKQVVWQELIIRREPVYYNMYASPLYRESSTPDGVILTFFDITDRALAQQKVEEAWQAAERAKEQAQKAYSAKNDFLSKISHELRTPLNAILGMSAVAAKTDDVGVIHSAIAKMNTASKSLLQLVNDVLDISKIEAGKMDLIIESFDFQKMMREVLEVVAFQSAQKDITLNVELSDDMPARFLGDKKRLSQVYTNLLSNALKYTRTGGSISISVRTKIRRDGRVRLESSVEDTGDGIRPEDLGKIFNSFEQGDDSLTRQHVGTGLGLAIVNNLVQLMGGHITVESRLGCGSKFAFDLDLEEDNAGEVKLNPTLLSGCRVLIVDDSEVSCKSMSDMLSRKGIISHWACSVEEAVEKAGESVARGKPYHIVFLDYLMPGTDGLETARMLNEILDETCCKIMMTVFNWKNIERQGRELGIRHFLSKPVLPEELFETMNRAFDPEEKVPEMEVVETFDFSGRRLLLVEDLDVNREIVLFMLEDTGIKCEEAVNGLDGLNAYLAHPERYDIILMDVQMPNLDGYEATRRIRESGAPNCRTIPIVAMTANVFDEQVKLAFDSGMNAHVGKPVDELLLKRQMAALLHVTPELREEKARPKPLAAAKLSPENKIDRQSALDRLDGDVELFYNLVSHFVSQDHVLKIQDALAKRDLPLAARLLHTVKGGAANLGLDGISELAGGMEERLLRERDVSVSSLEDITRLENFFSEVRENFKT